MLNLPNVKVNVYIPDNPVVLNPEGKEEIGRVHFRNTTKEDHHQIKTITDRLQARDWRRLREQFLNANIDEKDEENEVVHWLNEAGYLPAAQLSHHPERGPINRIPRASLFSGKDLTPKIVGALKSCRDALRIAMALSEEDFRSAVPKAHAYAETLTSKTEASADDALSGSRKWRLHPARRFLKDLAACATENKAKIADSIEYAIDDKRDVEVTEQLEQILRGGIGIGELRAAFHWDREGVPSVTVYVYTPIEAIRLSVQIDRNFSKRKSVCCPCGIWFDQKKGTDRFHDPKCRNLYTTQARRTKERLVQEGQQAWEALGAATRRGRDRWEWITAWAISKGRENDPTFTIEPGWAKKELTKP
jgi:hypothetical protein